jgi:hypothetical protein
MGLLFLFAPQAQGEPRAGGPEGRVPPQVPALSDAADRT